MTRARLAGAVLAIVLGVCAAFFLYPRGFLRFNYPSRTDYPVRGVDVSHHQGAIDWPAVRAAGFEFAFIKATEGRDHSDTRFRRNWEAAGAAGLLRGAYHFFTFCSPGRAQASHFLSTLGDSRGELPLAVDVEFAGNCKSWTSVAQIRSELRECLAALEAATGHRPLVYFTGDAYERILAGEFEDFAAWPRSVIGAPSNEGAPAWLFWQFADNGRVPGVARLVDLNVFRGGRAELESLVKVRVTLSR